jgi:hypothetical protein
MKHFRVIEKTILFLENHVSGQAQNNLTERQHVEKEAEALFVQTPVVDLNCVARPSISGLATKRLISTLNDIIYYLKIIHFPAAARLFGPSLCENLV